MELARAIIAKTHELLLLGSSKRLEIITYNLLESLVASRKTNSSRTNVLAIKRPQNATFSSTKDVDLHKIVDDAIKKVGGIKFVDANPEALLEELEYCEGLNLSDVHNRVQMLKKLESLKENQDETAIGDAIESRVPATRGDSFQQKQTVKDVTKIHVVKGTRKEVVERYKSSLSALDMPWDEIEKHMKSEKGMWDFCSLFEGIEISKDKLVQLWIANDFIQGKHKDQIADSYFEHLLFYGYIVHSSTRFPSENKMYKIVLNRKMIKNKTHGFRLKDKRLGLIGDTVDEKTWKDLKKREYLKAILLICNVVSNIKNIPDDVFSSLKHLEVLDLSKTQIKEVPNSVVELVDLRYLDVSSTLIELLPEEVSRLSKLQTLRLKDCRRLLRLPEETKKLTSLEHLDLDVLNQLPFMPREIGSLTQLKNLSAFLVHRDDGRGIQELEKMNNLEGSFCISGLENVSSQWEATKAALNEKENIKELELRWSELGPSSRGQDRHGILETLRPSFLLEKLQISCYHCVKFPSWICNPSFNKLTEITLFKCDFLNDFHRFGQLPVLVCLSLIEFAHVYKIGSRLLDVPNASITFPKLEKLTIVNFSDLVFWEESREEDYPNLSEIIIERCPVLETLPPTVLRRCTVKYLEVVNCRILSSFLDIKLSTSLATLIIEDCPTVKKWIQNSDNKKFWRKNISHVKTVLIDQVEN